jgi:hypothetical protein
MVLARHKAPGQKSRHGLRFDGARRIEVAAISE